MHHERCDGSGYPFGLYASDIDDYASIIAVADVYDAMTANRCYRLGLCPFEVIAQFEQEACSATSRAIFSPFSNTLRTLTCTTGSVEQRTDRRDYFYQ